MTPYAQSESYLSLYRTLLGVSPGSRGVLLSEIVTQNPGFYRLRRSLENQVSIGFVYLNNSTRRTIKIVFHNGDVLNVYCEPI